MAQWLTPDVQAVVFDAVGTLLFPSIPAPQVYAAVAHRAGLHLDLGTVRTRFLEAYQAQERVDEAAGWVTSEQREHERWQRIVAATLFEVPQVDDCFRILFDHFAQPAAWQPHPEAREVIANLASRGYRLGMGSNYDSRLTAVLAGFPELRPLRQRVIISSLVGFRKPARQFFAEVIHQMECQPHQVLFVGDDLTNDYLAATEAGLAAVLLDTENRQPEIPRRIRRLTELLA